MSRKNTLTLAIAALLLFALPLAVTGCKKRPGNDAGTVAGETTRAPSDRTGRNYYAAAKTSFWAQAGTGEPVYFYFAPSVDETDPGLKQLYRDSLTLWLPTCDRVGLILAETTDPECADITLQGWEPFENEVFGYTDINNRGNLPSGVRYHCRILLNEYRRDRGRAATARVLTHEWGHVLFADGEVNGVPVSPDRRDIMRVPTVANRVSPADSLTMEMVYRARE